MYIEINEANRFSMYFSSPDPVLLSWIDWFQAKNVGARLALTHKGWAVYKNGLLQIKD